MPELGTVIFLVHVTLPLWFVGGMSYWFDIALRFPIYLCWISYHWTIFWRFNIKIQVSQSFFWWYYSLNFFFLWLFGLFFFKPDYCLIFANAGSNFLSVVWLVFCSVPLGIHTLVFCYSLNCWVFEPSELYFGLL